MKNVNGVNDMLEFIGFIFVTLLLVGTMYTGAVVAALSGFDNCKKTLWFGIIVFIIGFVSLLSFWYNTVN